MVIAKGIANIEPRLSSLNTIGAVSQVMLSVGSKTARPLKDALKS